MLSQIALQTSNYPFEILLLLSCNIHTSEMPQALQDLKVEFRGCPILPHLDHVRCAVILLAHVPSMDGERELGEAVVHEPILVKESEIRTDHRLVLLWPHCLIEYGFSRRAIEMLGVPIP